MYSESIYGLLDSGDKLNVMSNSLVKRLRLQLTPTNRRFIVADGTLESCAGIISKVHIRFGDIEMFFDFMVIDSVPYELIIGSPALAENFKCIDM